MQYATKYFAYEQEPSANLIPVLKECYDKQSVCLPSCEACLSDWRISEHMQQLLLLLLGAQAKGALVSGLTKAGTRMYICTQRDFVTTTQTHVGCICNVLVHARCCISFKWAQLKLSLRQRVLPFGRSATVAFTCAQPPPPKSRCTALASCCHRIQMFVCVWHATPPQNTFVAPLAAQQLNRLSQPARQHCVRVCLHSNISFHSNAVALASSFQLIPPSCITHQDCRHSSLKFLVKCNQSFIWRVRYTFFYSL